MPETKEQKTVKKGRKYDQVLAGARQVFMDQGFEGASVDEIARAAGVSKATLYSYFPDKRILFIKMAETECGNIAENAVAGMDFNQPPETVLPMAARILVDIMLTDFNRNMFKMAVAEADRFPEIAQSFYECGPLLVRKELSPYMIAAGQRGELRIHDTTLAADQFAELCKTKLFLRAVLGIQTEFSEAEKEDAAATAAATFLAAYGTRG